MYLKNWKYFVPTPSGPESKHAWYKYADASEDDGSVFKLQKARKDGTGPPKMTKVLPKDVFAAQGLAAYPAVISTEFLGGRTKPYPQLNAPIAAERLNLSKFPHAMAAVLAAVKIDARLKEIESKTVLNDDNTHSARPSWEVFKNKARVEKFLPSSVREKLRQCSKAVDGEINWNQDLRQTWHAWDSWLQHAVSNDQEGMKKAKKELEDEGEFDEDWTTDWDEEQDELEERYRDEQRMRREEHPDYDESIGSKDTSEAEDD